MLKQEAREIQKELYGSTQDMQMRTTYSQLHPDIERAAPRSTAVSGTSDQTEGALFRSKCSITGGLLLLSSFSVFTALVPRDALCTVTGKRYWNSEQDDESMNAGCRCRTSHQAERQIQSGVWNHKTYLHETEGDTIFFKRSLSVCAQQTLLRELSDTSVKALPLQCKYLASPWLVVRTVWSSC